MVHIIIEHLHLKESDGELEINKFAQQLKELREYYDMTQAEVAACLKFLSAAISNCECRARESRVEELILLTDFFHVSLERLVGRIHYQTKIGKRK